MTDTYPIGERSGLWAFDVIKLLHKTGAAKQLGPSAVLIVAHVAIGEHREDYLIPPSFWNTELMTAAGISDDEAFVAARRRAVTNGWLTYRKGGIRQAGQYWAEIPKEIEARLAYTRKNRSMTGSSPDHSRSMTGSLPDHDRIITGSSPDHDRHLSLPLPSPIPIPIQERERETPPAQPDIKKQNSQRLQKLLRQMGASWSSEAQQEWTDFMQGPMISAKTADEVLYLIEWAIRTLRDEGIITRYVKHATPIEGRIKAELRKYRKENTKYEAKP